MLLSGTAAIFWTVQYAMLGAWTGVTNEILVMIRSFTSALLKNEKQKHLAAAIFIFGFIITGWATYRQPYDLLMVASCVMATISMVYLQQLPLRYGMLAATLLWLGFNYAAGTIGGTFAALTSATVQIVTIVRMLRDKRMVAA